MIGNIRTREVEAAMKAVAEEAFLQTVYKDPKLPLSIRMDAAAKAARFERPMLASSNVRVIRSFEDLSDEELQLLAPASFVDFEQGIARTHNCAGERPRRSHVIS